uniref:Uncharacterized protein n=1 Tax=Arundo donax TaxID=35708 RepID=A0A0A9EH32_ARUDO
MSLNIPDWTGQFQ